ncbi:MAG TPA: D-amino acid dehydrogenase [Alphaproteobacteria bacterium]|nr:D-amino acid dehydrogenase [Alphaproteobacteria bacterium]
MKVIVLGGGVIGVAAAYYLMADGHEVTVVEARAGAGLETSFSNGGQLVASHSEPWASPTTLRLMVKWLGRRDTPIIVPFRAYAALAGWGLRFLRNCTAARAATRTARNLRLGLANRALIADVRAATGIAYDDARSGALTLFREAKSFAQAAHHAEALAALDCVVEVADRARTFEIEPALNHLGDKIAGGLFTPGDETGDCHKFTGALAEYCEAHGVAFRTGTRITGIEAEGDRITRVTTDTGALAADAYVLAAGPWSARLARPLGLRLPVIPVKGYAFTAPMAGGGNAPRVGITDQASRITYTPLGQRLRVVSTAEFAGFNAALNPRRIALMAAAARELLPEAADYCAMETWAGLRPATPDNVPILGPTKYRNLWLDTGHGTLGWTQACASGRLVADLIAGREPGIDPEGLTLARF